MTKPVNGYSNRATWLTNLHFGDYFISIARECDMDAEQIAEFMEDHMMECADTWCLPSDFGRSMSTQASMVCRVDFKELAGVYVVDARA